MKKKVLAIAVTTLLAAPFAAQSATTLYGQAHMSIDYQDGDLGSGVDLLTNSSRVGVKGTHKINDSLKAVYQMEWGVTMDGEGSTMGARNRVAGLAGGFGTVLFGHHDTPFKGLGNAVAEDWGTTQMGGARQIRSQGGWDKRANNVLAWISPKMGPVGIFAAYVPDAGGSGDGNAEFLDGTDEVTAVSAVLNIGDKKKFYAGLGYESVDNGTDTTDAVRLGLIGNMGAIRLHGLFQQSTDDGFVAGADRTVYGVGASMKAGSNKFKAQYYVGDDYDNAVDTGGSLAMIGVDHSLSKTTTVYAQVASISNDANATFNLVGNGHGTGAEGARGGDISGLSLGLQVKF